MKVTLLIEADIPTKSTADWVRHVHDAVIAVGYLPPDHPLFHLDRATVKLFAVKPVEIW